MDATISSLSGATHGWVRKRILILGTTYPAYSQRYVELVCTGGIEEHTCRMVRIHPVPKRYLDDDQGFKNFQWVEALTKHNAEDGRPESLRIDFSTIVPQEELAARDHGKRRALIERSPHLVRSVETLQDLNIRDKTSLGVLMPKSIDAVRVRMRSERERQEWLTTEAGLLNQTNLSFIRPPKKIDFPEAEFLVTWHCDDRRCNGHTQGIKSWPIHELFRKLKGDPNRLQKTTQLLEREFDLRKRDVFLFMGTFHNHRTTFGLMDAFRPPRQAQLRLLP